MSVGWGEVQGSGAAESGFLAGLGVRGLAIEEMGGSIWWTVLE